MLSIAFIGTVRPFGNKGDESIYITSFLLTRKYLQKVKIILLSPEFYPSYEKLKKYYNVDIVSRHPMGVLAEILTHINVRSSILERIAKYVCYNTPPHISALALKILPLEATKSLKEANAYVIISHPFEKKGFPTYIASFVIPRYFSIKKPILAFPFSIHTEVTRNYIQKFVVRNALKKSNVLLTRGYYTSSYLRKHPGLTNVVTSFDPAITLPAFRVSKKPSETIAITPAGPTLPHLLLAKLIDTIIERLQKRVCLVPTDVNDVKTAQLIKTLVRNKRQCKILDTRNMDPREIKGFLSYVDLLISSRVHAAIFALSEAVPTLIIGNVNDLKFHDVLGYFGLEQYIFDSKVFNARPNMMLDKLSNK